MSEIKYLLDENVDPRLHKALQQAAPEITVWAVGQPGAPTRGTLDPEILDWCGNNGFLLVTNNRASMPVHLNDHVAAGKTMPGIFIIDPYMTMGEMSEELALIQAASDPEEYVNRIAYLPLSY